MKAPEKHNNITLFHLQLANRLLFQRPNGQKRPLIIHMVTPKNERFSIETFQQLSIFTTLLKNTSLCPPVKQQFSKELTSLSEKAMCIEEKGTESNKKGNFPTKDEV